MEDEAPVPNRLASPGIEPEGDPVRFSFDGRPVEGIEGETLAASLTAWVRDMTLDRRAEPREDLISDLATAHDLDDQLTIDEIVSVVTALISAGTETTVAGGVFGLRSLLHHPDSLAGLRIRFCVFAI